MLLFVLVEVVINVTLVLLHAFSPRTALGLNSTAMEQMFHSASSADDALAQPGQRTRYVSTMLDVQQRQKGQRSRVKHLPSNSH